MKTRIDELMEKFPSSNEPLTPKDFKVDQDIRWCSGCGDYSVLSQVQKILPTFGLPKEKFAFISGIGCSSRFPYYIDTYGMHGIHGRALALASGLKVARPDLSVWVATGDGDCMSIGGNHFIHAVRRNIDLNIMMFNNEIYSLTKGQYSPTSHQGQITKSSPWGVVDYPFNPASLALGSGATFVARCLDVDIKTMQKLLEKAYYHKGTAFIEIYTNCVVFNDGAFVSFSEKEVRKEKTVLLEHGKPLVFGANNDKGIKLDGFTPKVVELNGNNSVNDLLVHDEKDSTLAFILANMTYNYDLPRPVGIFQSIDKKSYEVALNEQIEYARSKKGDDLQKLLMGDEYIEIA